MRGAPEPNRSRAYANHHPEARTPPSALPALHAQAAALLPPSDAAAELWERQPSREARVLCQHAVRVSSGGSLPLASDWKTQKAGSWLAAKAWSRVA